MVACCHCLLCSNSTIKEDDDVFFFATPPQKKMTAHCHCLFLLKHKEDKTHKKTTKKTKRKEGACFQALALSSHFWFLLLPFCFKRFLLASFSSQKTKNHREEKKCKERKELSFKLLLCPFTFGSHFCPFVSNAFSLHLLLKQKKRKENTKEKKTIEKKKYAKKGGNLLSRELTFKLLL